MKTLIYIASPYSHSDPVIRAWRYEKAVGYTLYLTSIGEICFSPIAYGHQFALRGLRGDAGYWAKFNRQMMLASHSIHLLMLPGWEESEGVNMELDFASVNMMPVVHVPFEDGRLIY